VHSYWDDFFALRGLKDAVVLADALGEEREAAAIAALRDGLQTDLHASIRALINERKLDYIPASVELSDFDPSSTAVALAPAGEQARLPQAELARTFARYYEEVLRRRRGEAEWDAYSPYELRTVSALVRLGERERALEVLDQLLAGRRPMAWNQWAEVVWRDPSAPRFIGDMPHTWIAADYVRAVRDLFAYEREDDRALVVAAGIPASWLGEQPVGARRLPTEHGILTYGLSREGPTTLRLRLSGDLSLPPGGIIVQPPLPGPLTSVTANGRAVAFAADQVRIDEFPAEVVLEHSPPPAAGTPETAP
jgi:hypothetical protein